MKARAHVIVSGRVQGIFFRANTREKANECGVTGWVRNTADGKVEAVFEGEKDDVEKLLRFCRKGPPGAVVTEVKIRWGDFRNEFKDFGIRYV